MSWASVFVGFLAGSLWTCLTMGFGMAYQEIRRQAALSSEGASE